MKFLKFKILKKLYIKLFFIAFIFPSFGGVGGGLYAQDPELFEHTWYFQEGELNGEIFYPLSYFTGNIDFYADLIEVYHNYCEEGFASLIDYDLVENEFLLDFVEVVLIGVCSENEDLDFMNKHYSIYGTMDGTGAVKNPFVYIIESVGDNYQLTVENGNGDWAVYNSVLLSLSTFHQNSFTLYPNPVKEVLQINTSSSEMVKASIYDINGKLLQTHSLENIVSSIDVKALKQGMYFVVFESETGERVSKKFVKK